MAHSSFSENIRYFFDNTLSKGPMGLLIWLGLFVSIVIIFISIFVWTTGISSQDSITEQAWSYMMSSLGAADAETEGGWLFRFASLFVIFSGIFVMGTLISILTTTIDRKLEQLRRGRSRVIESGHTVILGWGDEILVLIKELVTANENHANSCIAILAEEDKIKMESRIYEAIGPQKNTRIICRSGNSSIILDLNLVSINTAKSIVILGVATDITGLAIMKSVLSIIKNPDRRVEPYHIVAAIDNPKIIDSLKLISKDEIEVIYKSEFITKIEAQTLLHSGLSLVITDLLDFKGDEIYFKKQPELTGKSYKEVLLAYDTSAVIGFITHEGKTLINPPLNTILRENDQIIAISNDDDTVIISDKKHPSINMDDLYFDVRLETKAENILILGWNQHSLKLIQHLSENTPEGSKIIVAASCNDSRLQVKTLEPRINLNLEHIEIDPTDRIHLEGLPFEIVDHVVILPCYELEFNGKPLTLNQSDANTLITLLNVQHIRQKNKYPLTITSEILNVENRTLVESSDNDDFVLSDYLISLALVQISENKALAPIFNGLFDPDGCEIYLKPITNYVKTNQSISFFTVVEAALMQNETAIGYRISSQSNNSNGLNKKYDTVLNPNKTKMFEFGAEDKIIVLAED